MNKAKLSDFLEKELLKQLAKKEEIDFFHLIVRDIRVAKDFGIFRRKESKYNINRSENFENFIKRFYEGFLFLNKIFNRSISIVTELLETPIKRNYHIISKVGDVTKIEIYSKESHIRIIHTVKYCEYITEYEELKAFTYNKCNIELYRETLDLDQFITEIENIAKNSNDKKLGVFSCDLKLENFNSFKLEPPNIDYDKKIVEHLIAFNYPTKENPTKQVSFYLYPAYRKNNIDKVSAGLVCFSSKDQFIDVHDDKNINIPYWSTVDILEQTTEVLHASLKKATVTSIMARNLSHNFGSHVLGNDTLYNNLRFDTSSNEEIINPRKETIKFHHYLQSRLDFISRIVSDAPRQYETLFFFSDLFNKYMEQGALIGTLAADSGYLNKHISFQVTIQEKEKSYLFNFNEDENRYICPTKGELADFLIAIPGGMTGCHAFYSILENLIRNAVKYGENQSKLTLFITIKKNKMSEKKPGHYQFFISENLSNITKEDEIREKLHQPILNEDTGFPNHGGHGLLEIKESARFLNGLQDKPIDVSTDGNRLGFEFLLWKPILIGFYNIFNGATDKRKLSWKTENIAEFFSLDTISTHGAYFAVLLDEDILTGNNQKNVRENVLKFIIKKSISLPYRLMLFVTNDSVMTQWNDLIKETTLTFNKNRIKLIHNKNFAVNLKKVIESTQKVLILNIYELWIRAFKPLANEEKYNILIGFENNIGAWGKLLSEFSSDLLNIGIKNTKNHHLYNDDFGEFGKNKTVNKKDFCRTMVFDNHGEVFKALGCENLRSYHEFGIKNIELFQELLYPPTSNENFKFFMYSLLETSLLEVLIIDERILNAVLSNSKIIENLKKVNVSLANKVDDTPILLELQDTDNPPENGKLNDNDLVQLNLKENDSKLYNNYDAVIFHHGKFEELHVKRGFQYQDLYNIYKCTPVFLWTSGRGYDLKRTQSIKKKMDAQFIDFNEVNYSTYLTLNKFELGKAILSKYGIEN